MQRSTRFADLALLLCVAALQGACATVSRGPAPAGDDVLLAARILASADARRTDLPLLEAGLAHNSAHVRRLAASAAGNLRALPLASRLFARARDDDASVARTAAFALALLRDTSAVARLDSLVDSRDRDVARGAAWGLGEIGEPSRAPIERRLRAASAQPTSALAELLLAASRLRPVPAVLIEPLLTHADSTVQWTAAYALARSRVPAGVRALVSRAGSPNDMVRAYVARGIAKGAAGDSLAPLTLPALLGLAADPHPHVRISAARALASYGARPELTALAHDPDANVRIAAAQAWPAALPLSEAAAESLWSADTGLTYRRAVLAAAARSGQLQQTLLSWSAAADWNRRAATVEAIAAMPPVEAIARLQRFATDEDARVRASAVSALGAFADSAAHAAVVLPPIRAALADADWQVRAAALGALATRPRAADAPSAIAVLLGARDRGDAADARIAAIRLLAGLWRQDSLSVPAAVAASARALRAPADHAERVAGAASPLFAGWRTGADSAGTPHPLSWYEDVARRFAFAATTPLAVIHTSRGEVELELFAHDAPLTVENFVRLARTGYFDGTVWHRVVPAFVAQDGDPRGDGSGGPGYAIRDEQNPARYDRGALGMALSGPDTGGSQYFITLSPQPHLDGHYTVFGRVRRGFEVLDALVQGDAIRSIDVR